MVKRLKKNKGFTLVELVVVIIILAILVGVTISGIFIYVRQSRIATDLDTASAIQSACSVLEVDEDVIDAIQSDLRRDDDAEVTISWNDHVENKDIKVWGNSSDSVEAVSKVVKKLFPDGLPAPKTAGRFKLIVSRNAEGDVKATCRIFDNKGKPIVDDE